MFSRILCPLDGSDHSQRALEVAISLAKSYGSSLVLVHALLRSADSKMLQRFAEIEGLSKHVEAEVISKQIGEERLGLNLGPAYKDTAVSSRPLIEIGQHILDGAKQDATQQGVKNVETTVVDGDAADLILRCIDEQDIDCVVMGSRGLSVVKGVFMGSVSHKVMNRAPCTCIAVK
ncbi:MAG TPA: universal stress protein [Marinobacter sp.]|nr:universal stress protein [Marinobacter sp.]